MPVAARSDEHGSRLHPFPGVRPPRRGQWTAKAHQPRTALVTAAKVSNARMKGTQFSSCNPILPFRMIANPGCLVRYLRHKAATAVLPPASFTSLPWHRSSFAPGIQNLLHSAMVEYHAEFDQSSIRWYRFGSCRCKQQATRDECGEAWLDTERDEMVRSPRGTVA
jgi:hypothetical protein